MSRCFLNAFLATSLIFVGSLSAQQATDQAPSKQQDRQPGPDMGMILVKGLKSTDGCLGVKTCRWDDGKQSIVAWFEDKDAAATWYYSATHQTMIGQNTDMDEKKDEPMQHIKNGNQPIMVIASLTPARKPELPGINIPISQISIELFGLLPGGAQVGGRVTPDIVEVPHMKSMRHSRSNPAKQMLARQINNAWLCDYGTILVSFGLARRREAAAQRCASGQM